MRKPATSQGVLAGSRTPASNDRRKSARVIHICDTAPLIAFLNRNDPYHARAVGLLRQVPAPLLSCEAMLAEAA